MLTSNNFSEVSKEIDEIFNEISAHEHTWWNNYNIIIDFAHIGYFPYDLLMKYVKLKRACSMSVIERNMGKKLEKDLIFNYRYYYEPSHVNTTGLHKAVRIMYNNE